MAVSPMTTKQDDEDFQALSPDEIENQRTNSFGFDRIFSGWNDGKVFIYDEYNSTKVKEFKQMLDTDGKASSVEKLLSYPILAAPWEIKESPGDKGEAKFIREFFESNEHNGGMETPIENVISQMTFAMTVRRVYFELVPKVRDSDGMFIWQSISWCPPETCELALNEKTSKIEGFRQYPNAWYGPYSRFPMPNSKDLDEQQMIPVYGPRAFVYVHGVWRDPVDGLSSMQVAHWAWETKRKLMFLWYSFLEQSALPKTIVKNEDENKAKADARKFAMLRSRDVLGISNETDFEIFESSGKGAQSYIDAIKWLDSEMSNSVLGGFMDLTSSAASGKGSFALSSDQSTLFLRTRRVVARDMARQITNQIIAPLIRWNFGKGASVPQFVFGPLSEANEEKVLDLFSAVTTASGAAKMPVEFLEMLSVRVANILELDPSIVTQSFQKMVKNYKKEGNENEMLATVVGSVAAAKQMLEAAQAGADPMDGGNAVEDHDPDIPAPPDKTEEDKAKEVPNDSSKPKPGA